MIDVVRSNEILALSSLPTPPIAVQCACIGTVPPLCPLQGVRGARSAGGGIRSRLECGMVLLNHLVENDSFVSDEVVSVSFNSIWSRSDTCVSDGAICIRRGIASRSASQRQGSRRNAAAIAEPLLVEAKSETCKKRSLPSSISVCLSTLSLSCRLN